MKFNFKKIVPIFVGAILLGSTVGFAGVAAETAYPASFANAVVVASGLDMAAANLIADSLADISTAKATGGELLKAAGDVMNYGDDLEEMVAAGISSDELPNILADGTYDDSEGDTDNDVDYDQSIELDPDAANTVALALDIDENDTDEAAGTYLFFSGGDNIYSYTLEFDEEAEYDNTDADSILDDWEGSEIEIQGKVYTITDATGVDAGNLETLTLMGGTTEVTQGEGTTATYTVSGKSYEVEVVIISDDALTVKLKVNGETTDAMEEGDTYELDDGTVIGVREVLPNEGSEAAGADQVTFYLGADSIELEDDGEVTINGETIDDYTSLVTFTETANVGITAIQIDLATDDDLWIGEGESWTDPVFGAWSINFRSLDKTTEEIELDVTSGDEGTLTFINNDGDEIELPLITTGAAVAAWGNDEKFIDSNGVGDADGEGLSGAEETAMAFDNNDLCGVTDTTALDNECDGFLFTVISAGGEARLYSIDNHNAAADTVDIVDEQTGDTIEEDASCLDGDVITISGMGDIELDCTSDATDDFIQFDLIDLTVGPTGDMETSLGGAIDLGDGVVDTATFALIDANGGDDITTITAAADGDMTADVAGLAWLDIEEDSDTEIALDDADWGIIYTNADTTDDTKITIEYPEEVDADSGVEANVYAVEGAVAGTNAVSVMSAAEVESKGYKATKNLVVVGGSAVNAIAADLLNVAEGTKGTEAAWITATGVSENMAIIKLYSGATEAFGSGQIALLVAGYAQKDTLAAVNYLISKKEMNKRLNTTSIAVASIIATSLA